MGRGRVEVFKMIFPNKHEGFVDLFLESLDSWFSADIACCDACYDEFVRRNQRSGLFDSAVDTGMGTFSRHSRHIVGSHMVATVACAL
jgi:hypothetical protein